MEWGSAADWIGAISQFLAAIVTIIIVYQTKSTINLSLRTERLRVFTDFARQYDELRNSYYSASAPLENDAGEVEYWPSVYEDDSVTKEVYKLWKFFEREHVIWKEGMIDNITWRIWKKGMGKTLDRSDFRLFWKHDILSRTDFSKDFTIFIKNEFYREQ